MLSQRASKERSASPARSKFRLACCQCSASWPALRGRLRLARGGGVSLGGEHPLTGTSPVGRDACRLRLARQQEVRDPPVQQPRDRGRHRCAGGIANQVVRKGAAAQHLRRFELAPRFGDVERVRIEHGGGQLGIEAGAGQRRDPGQLQGGCRQLCQPSLDQRPHGRRLRQAIAGVGGTGEQHVLQCLQREHRVAAGVPEQGRRQARGVDLRQRQRLHQFGQQRHVQRSQQDGLQTPCLLQRRAQRRSRCAGVGRPLREAPVQVAEGVRLGQRLQEFDAGVVGEVQVVDDRGAHPRRRRVGQRRIDGAVQQQPLRLARQRRAVAEFGQQQRQRPSPCLVQCRRQRLAREHCTQQPRQQRIGDAGVARPRLHADHPVQAGGKLLQQARLADAALAEQREDAPFRPGACQRRQFDGAADEPRRPHQAGGHHRAACRQCGGAALDRRHQFGRLRRRPGAELVLQPCLEAFEGRDRRAAVAAQVVQPHEPALRVLGQRIAFDQPLRVGQAANDGAAGFAVGCRRGQGRVASIAPAPARGVDPGREVRVFGIVQVAQQLFVAGVLVAGDGRQRIRQVGLHAGSELQPGAAGDEARAGVAAQPEQALAQIRIGLPAVGVGPQQGHRMVRGDRAVEGHQSQQGGVLGRQRQPGRSMGTLQAGPAEQAQPPAIGCGGLRRVGWGGCRHRRPFHGRCRSGHGDRSVGSDAVDCVVGALPLPAGYRARKAGDNAAVKQARPPLVRTWKHGTGGRSGLRRAA